MRELVMPNISSGFVVVRVEVKLKVLSLPNFRFKNLVASEANWAPVKTVLESFR